MRHSAILATAFLALAAPASAHDIWLTPGPGGVHVHYGHPHEQEMPRADKLISLTAYRPSGVRALAAQMEAGPGPILKAAVESDALVAAAYDNGYWVRLSDGSYRNASKRMVPDADKSIWSVKFAKAALGPSAQWERVVGHPLEILPLQSPATASGEIRVRVLFEGRPLSAADVLVTDGTNFRSETDQVRAATDAQGVAIVPLRVAGPQVLAVHHRVAPSQTPALADTDNYVATFAFDVTDPTTN